MMIEILIALAIVGAVGLLAGILLAVVSHFFHVPEDQTAVALRACLPGINCGACVGNCPFGAITMVKDEK